MDRGLKVKFAALEMATSLLKKAMASGGDVPLSLVAQAKVASQEFCEACESTTATGEPSPQVQAGLGSTAGDLQAAEETLALLNRTASKITLLEKEGKKFNATKARQDLYKIAAAISTFSQSDTSGVDIHQTSAEARRIASLFGVSLSLFVFFFHGEYSTCLPQISPNRRTSTVKVQPRIRAVL